MKSGRERIIFLVDMQSFYASVEKAAHPEFRDKPLIVAGDPARRSGIVLAACPIAKRYGVTTAERLGEAVRKCPEVIVIRPHMQEYINVSLQISGILERFSDLVEPYSIDEQQRTELCIEARYLCRGYQHRFSMLWGLVKAELNKYLSKYLNVDLRSSL